MSPTRMTRRLATLLVGTGLWAAAPSCTVGPDYRRPDLGLTAGYKSATTQEVGVPAVGRDWWRLFGDPVLNDLESIALAANTDVRAAVARVAQARASTLISSSAFYPVVTLDPSVSRTRSPRNGVFVSNAGGVSVPTTNPGGGGTSGGGGGSSGGTAGRTSTSVRVPFDLSYEVDIWGRVRRSVEAATADQRAAEADFEVVLQTLEADVAQNYFTLRSLDAQDEILGRTVESYRREVELTQKQLNAGLISPIDLYQAKAQLSATTTQQIENRRQRADVEHALAVLLGRTPAELALAHRPLDLDPPVVPVGLPADLLRRRPDVAAAEMALAAASARVGVAQADFYPAVRLTGAAGFQSFDLRHAVDWEQRVWSLGPSVSFPLFEGGRLEASLQQARSQFDESLANYRGRVLTAVRDVEDSLTDLHHRAAGAAAQAQAVEASREYRRLSQIQYERGITGYLQVIDAERTLLQNELSAAQLLNQRLASTVLLIKSLGGGWDAGMPPTTAPTTLPSPEDARRAFPVTRGS